MITNKYRWHGNILLKFHHTTLYKRVRRSLIDANLRLLDNEARIYDNELLMLKARIDKWWAGIK